VWVHQAVADRRLRSEVDHAVEAVDTKGGIDGGPVGEIGADKCKIPGTGSACLFDQHESRFLEGRIVIVVDNIEADHVVAPRDQLPRGMEGDETSGTANEDLHVEELALFIITTVTETQSSSYTYAVGTQIIRYQTKIELNICYAEERSQKPPRKSQY
jgi:hypothetical protein